MPQPPDLRLLTEVTGVRKSELDAVNAEIDGIHADVDSVNARIDDHLAHPPTALALVPVQAEEPVGPVGTLWFDTDAPTV